MKKLFIPLAAVVLCAGLLTGCKSSNPNVGPAAVRLSVSTAAGYSITKWTNAVPAVRASADIICSAAEGTDLSPTHIVAALDAYNGKTPESVFIVNAAIGAYTLIYNGLSDTNAAKPYVLAVCNGLNDALGLVQIRGPAAPPNTQWPQVKFP